MNGKNPMEEFLYECFSDDAVEAFEIAIDQELGIGIGTRDSFDQHIEKFFSKVSSRGFRRDEKIHGLRGRKLLEFYEDVLQRDKPAEFLKEQYDLENDQYEELIENIFPAKNRPESSEQIIKETNSYLDTEAIPLTDVAVSYIEADEGWSGMREINDFAIDFMDLDEDHETTEVRDTLTRLRYEGILKSRKGLDGELEYKLRKRPREDQIYRTVRESVSAEQNL